MAHWVVTQLDGTEYEGIATKLASDFDAAGIVKENVQNIPVLLRTFYGASPDKLVQLLQREVPKRKRKAEAVK